MIYDLHCTVPDVVHPLHPQHLILRLELFGDALTLWHLPCQQEHLLRRLLVDVGQVGVQPTAGQQLRVKGFTLLFEVSQVSLPPNADGLFFFGGYCQTRNVIVALQLVL